MKNKSTQKLLTISEAAELLHVHPNSLRKWDEKGLLKAIRIGIRKDRRYRKDDLMRLIKITK